MAVRLFLTDATAESAGVSATPQAVTVPDPDISTGFVRDLSLTKGTPRQSPVINSLAQTGAQRLMFGKWVSPPLTGIATLSANTWTIGYVGREGNLNANMFPLFVLYVRKADGTVRGFVSDVDAGQDVELTNVSPPPASIYSLTGSAVAGIQPTDRLVCEVYTRGAQGSATSYSIRGINYNGLVDLIDGVADATGDEATFIETPQNGLFDPATPPPPDSQTKLYLHGTTDNVAGFVTTEKSAAMSPVDQANQAHDLLENLPPGPSQVNSVTTTPGGISRYYMGKWISPPLAGITSMPAGDWLFDLAGNVAADVDAFFAVSIQILKADDTIRGYVYDADANHGVELNTSMRGREFTIPGALVGSIAVDDVIAVEIWLRATPATAQQMRLRFAGTVEPVDGVAAPDPACYVIVPSEGMFGTTTAVNHAGTITPAGAHTFALAGSFTGAGTITPSGTHVFEQSDTFPLFAGEIAPTGEHSFTVLRYSDPCDAGDVQWWMTYCNNEVSNLARTWEYLKRYRPRDIEIICEPNGVLYRIAGQTTPDDPVFVHPSADPAPWYDASRPESAEFLGFVGKPVPGPAVSRAVTRRGSGGASLGPLRVTERIVQVDGFLFAVTSRGLDYGFRWLSDLIAGDDDCATCEIEIMTASPQSSGSDDTVGRWRLFNTGVADPGVEMGERYCAEAMAVTFKMVAGDGYLYKDPELILPLEALPDVDPEGGCVGWSQWMCEAPDAWLYSTVNPPASGSSGVIVTIDALDSAINGVRIDAMTDCPDGEIISTMRTELIPEGSILVIDSARQVITFIDADGNQIDGSSYIHLRDGETIPWVVLRQNQGARCIRVGRDRFCSTGGGQVRVAVQTQERRR